MRRLIVIVAVLGLVMAAGAAFVLQQPYRGFSEPVLVDVPRGTSTRQIAERLEKAGVVRSSLLFEAVRALRSGTPLQAGEYRFDRPVSAWEAYGKIARGDVFTYELRVPEGSNRFDIAALVDRQGLIQGRDFLRVTADASLIRDLDPQAPSLEGYLFPATYRFPRATSAEQLARQMTQRFRQAWREAAGSGKPDVHRAVTLASLVEKEARVPGERPMVASVYANRLARGMKLDCDPTVIYAALLENRYRGTIYRSDLDNDHPYNTYRHPGLPPGPIANAGLPSLKAALQPAESDYLFFVADAAGSGAHRFSRTLAEHSAAVREYRGVR